MFFSTPWFYSSTITLPCIGFIIPSQLHPSSPLLFTASLINRIWTSYFRTWNQNCTSSFTPFSCTSSPFLPSGSLVSPSKMLHAGRDTVWTRICGEASIASLRKATEEEVQWWIRGSQMCCGSRWRRLISNYFITCCEVLKSSKFSRNIRTDDGRHC